MTYTHINKIKMAPKVVYYCLACVRWTPVVFIVSIIVWSYYAYVVQMCIFYIDNAIEKVLYLILYHPILGMFLWSYWKTMFTDPGYVPKEFYLGPSVLERFDNAETSEAQNEILKEFARDLPVQCRTNKGEIRYCEKCRAVKPDRVHHCSVCGRCVLKMDHHCPWVNNCVNFTNYKYFVLFLGWGLGYCVFVAATSAQYFVRFWTGQERDLSNLHIVFLFFAGDMFAISLVSLFGYHVYLSSLNRSTLESFRSPIFRSGPDKDGFNLGKAGNFQEVFGDNKRQWFFPIYTSLGDGVTFPTRESLEPSGPANNYHSMDMTAPIATTETSKNGPTAPSMGDGVTYPTRNVDEDYDTLLGNRQRWMEQGDPDQNDHHTLFRAEDTRNRHGFENAALSTNL